MRRRNLRLGGKSDGERASANDAGIDLGDVSNPKYQNELIIDYLNRNFTIDDITASQIQKLNIELNLKLPSAEVIRNVIWKPKRFEFSNMF